MKYQLVLIFCALPNDFIDKHECIFEFVQFLKHYGSQGSAAMS